MTRCDAGSPDRAPAPSVSIIVNCFNGGKFLRQAIDSIMAQTYGDWELVFWDNQSTDDSASIIQSYDDPRIRYYFADTHTVLYAARNLAFAKCRGALVAFLDSDDWWMPEKLALQVPLFSDPAVGMSCGNFYLVNERAGGKGRRKLGYESLPVGQVTNEVFREFFVHFSTFMVRRIALQSLDHGFDARFNIIGDFDLIARLSLTWSLAAVQAPIAHYRWHDGNTGFVEAFSHGDEFAIWLAENRDAEGFRSLVSLPQFEARLRLLAVLKALHDGDRAGAWRKTSALAMRHRAKACVALLLPTRLVRWWLARS